jgi:hypothetical protein
MGRSPIRELLIRALPADEVERFVPAIVGAGFQTLREVARWIETQKPGWRPPASWCLD